MEEEYEKSPENEERTAVDSLSADECTQKKEYLVIDHGEELKKQFEESKLEMSQKIKDLNNIIELMWEVLWSFMFISAQIAVGWTLMTFTKLFDSKPLEGCVVAVNSGICINILVFDAQRLKESIDQLLEAMARRTIYKPAGKPQTTDNQDTANINKQTREDESEETDDDSGEDEVQTVGQSSGDSEHLQGIDQQKTLSNIQR